MFAKLGLSADATGTADVITATFNPAITLNDNRIIFLRITQPNETGEPTFNPDSLGAKPVRRFGNVELFPRDLSGDVILKYHTSDGGYWELLNSKISRYLIAGDDNAYAYDRVVENGVWEASAGDDNASGTFQIQSLFSRVSHDDEVQLNAPSVTKNGDQVATEDFVTTGLLFKQNILTGASTGALVNGFAAKTTPVDADQFLLTDSAAGNAAKKITWSNIKAVLTTLFNSAYVSLTGSYADPSWITSLAWSKIASKPTTVLGYGITDGIRIILKDLTNKTVVTGTTANTLTHSFMIPANTFSVGDVPRINWMLSCAGVASGKTGRFYVNSLNQLLGATLCGTFTAGSTALNLNMSRMFAIKSVTETEFPNGGGSQAGADGAAVGLPTVANIDWSVNQYFLFTIQLGNSADSGVLSWYKMTN